MKSIAVSLALVTAVAAGCGSDDAPAADPSGEEASGSETETSSASAESSENGAGTDGDANGASDPVGPADMNTIRIGSQVWERTLPMTSGQCFVQNVEGLPPSGVAWGTLDGDDGIRFRASQNQDGTNEAEVDDQESFFWVAGPRVADGPDDLVIELDFEALTIVGQGTFTNLFTGETAPGSFAFQCEDDGTGG